MSAGVRVEFPGWQCSNSRKGGEGGVGKKVVHLCSTSRKGGFAIVYYLTRGDIGGVITLTPMGGHKLKVLEQGA
jgi:hypothetical protein